MLEANEVEIPEAVEPSKQPAGRPQSGHGHHNHRPLAGWLEVAEGGRAQPGAVITLVARVRRPIGGAVRLAVCTIEEAEGGRQLGQLTDR